MSAAGDNGGAPATSLRFPVAVLMETRRVRGRRWETSHTEAVGVVAGDHAAGAGRAARLVHDTADAQRYLYPGFAVELHLDDTLGYYSNLRAESPSVLVFCDRDEDDVLVPTGVTVSYGEAALQSETDTEMFAVPMPPEVYVWVERYVVEHHRPEEPKKRKRRDWKKESRAGG